MKRGPYKGKKELFNEAITLRNQGFGYRSISKQINTSWGTVRNWVNDIKISKQVSTKKSEPYKKLRFKYKLEDYKTNHGRRLFLIKIKGYFCWKCKNTNWLDKLIPLELNHINGDRMNNGEENLEILCPNCHALTDNYKGKNMKSYKDAVVAKQANAPDLNSGGFIPYQFNSDLPHQHLRAGI